MPEEPSSIYYSWQQSSVKVCGRDFVLYSKPGMARVGQTDHAAVLLANEMEVEPGEAVLLLNCGAGLPGLVAAEAGAHVTMVDANIVAVEAARRAAMANDLADAIAVTGSPPNLEGTPGQPDDTTPSAQEPGAAQPALQSPDFPKIGGRGADVVALLLPKGKAAALQSIWDAYQALKPGGHFFIAGANAEGAKTYFRYAEELFGPVAVRGYRKGCRVGAAKKPAEPLPLSPRFQAPWLDHDCFPQFDVTFGDRPLHICSRPGVFSWDRLDSGSEILLSVMEIGAADQVLDLGCGSGIVGSVAAMQATHGRVLMLDANINAVVSARRTLAANSIDNASVQLSDCAAVVQDRLFDVIVTNPPFHQGKATQYDVAYQFIRDADRLLKPGGRFYLIANRFIPYEETIRQSLGQVDTIHEDRRFKVLLGRKM